MTDFISKERQLRQSEDGRVRRDGDVQPKEGRNRLGATTGDDGKLTSKLTSPVVSWLEYYVPKSVAYSKVYCSTMFPQCLHLLSSGWGTFALSPMEMVEQGRRGPQRTRRDSVKRAAILPSAPSVTH